MSFYKEVKDSVICDLKEGEEVRYFIPESWFNSSIAFVTGEFINLLGTFSYAIYNSKTEKPISKLKRFDYPTAFLCKPSEIIKQKDIKLTEFDDPIDYRILKFVKGDKLIVELNVPQDVTVVEDMMKLFAITGHIPPNIPYNELHDYFFRNVTLSGNKYSGVPMSMLGIFVSELARDLHDPSKPFRLSPEKKKGEMTAYKSMSIKDTAKHGSAYQAFTSEQFDEAVISGMQSTNTNYSPLEKVLMGSPKEPSTKAEE